MTDNGNHIQEICAIFRATNLAHVAEYVEANNRSAMLSLIPEGDLGGGVRTVLVRRPPGDLAIVISEYLKDQPNWSDAHTRLKALQQRISKDKQPG